MTPLTLAWDKLRLCSRDLFLLLLYPVHPPRADFPAPEPFPKSSAFQLRRNSRGVADARQSEYDAPVPYVSTSPGATWRGLCRDPPRLLAPHLMHPVSSTKTGVFPSADSAEPQDLTGTSVTESDWLKFRALCRMICLTFPVGNSCLLNLLFIHVFMKKIQ